MTLRLDLHVFFHGVEDARLNTILTKLDLIIAKENAMSGELDALTAQVTTNNTLIDSTITLLNGLKAQLDAAIAANAAGDNGAALAALSTALGAKDQELAAAVVANTPAQP